MSNVDAGKSFLSYVIYEYTGKSFFTYGSLGFSEAI